MQKVPKISISAHIWRHMELVDIELLKWVLIYFKISFDTEYFIMIVHVSK